uniref:Zinc finger family protein n=1 Tax=Tetraselmis sp. GSL018 TaxID=582737 RepID=A0A061S1N7_9CHLO
MPVSDHEGGTGQLQTPPSIVPEGYTGGLVHAEENQHCGEPAAEDQACSDLALALLMQQQEQAYFFMTEQSIRHGGTGALHEGQGGAGEGDAGERAPSDVDLAMRLQQEEQRQFEQRLIAMAGIRFGGLSLCRGGRGSFASMRSAARSLRGGGEPEGREGGERPPPPLPSLPCTGGEEDEEDAAGIHEVPEVEQMSYESLLALGDIAGRVSRGAAAGAVAAIRTARFAPKVGAGEDEDEEQCAVCRMEFEAGEELSLLPCGHGYHRECIQRWLEDNKACPVCNTELGDKTSGEEA